MKLLPSVTAVLVLTAGPAMAQQNRERTVESGRIHPEHVLTLATTVAVKKELGVSQDVARQLMSLLRDYSAAEQKALQDAGITNTQDRLRFMAMERPKYIELTKKAQDEFIPKLQEALTSEQFQRLQQIQFQNRFNYTGPKTLLAPEVAAALKLTDDQKLQLDALSKGFSRGGPFQAINGKVTFSMESWVKHGKEYRTKAIELMTPEQKEDLNKLEGNEFDLSQLVIMSRLPPPR